MPRYSKLMTALLCALLIAQSAFTQTQWQPKNLRLATRWTKEVSATNALKEYPRPRLVRTQWINLNGLWSYAITDTAIGSLQSAEQIALQKFDGQILVPYPIESALSGVQRMLKADELLWYKTSFQCKARPNERTVLHFGAVDNEATVFVNGKEIGSHKGGYTAFTFDITSALKNGSNEIVVRVYDPTDQGVYPHGKQVSNPANIYYTPSSGIWQTVWMETVPDTYIQELKITPDVDNELVEVEVVTNYKRETRSGKGYAVVASVIMRPLQDTGLLPPGNRRDPASPTLPSGRRMTTGNAGRRMTAGNAGRRMTTSNAGRRMTTGNAGRRTTTSNAGRRMTISMPNPHLWSPDDPFLYDLEVKLVKNNKVIDRVTSYFGMRKVSVGRDEKGFQRIFLNNKYLYNLGTLDQGFWPDGLYTAPTDEALQFDIAAIKAMGFNTIRKHIKVEPARWYYHCDKLGMLVWQDFVNPHQQLPEGAKSAFEKQLNETMQQLYNHPSITTWVLFNERWGAYDQQRLTETIKRKDPSRLLNAHSGELLWVNEKLRAPSDNPWPSSDIADIHAYPDPMNVPDNDARNKVKILGEFGGIGVFIPDHQWLSNKSWGYVQVTPAQLQGKYAVMNAHLQLLEREGLAGSIYTQPYDVEGEENGLMTYDREIIKIPLDSLRKIHAHLVPTATNIPSVSIANADLADPGQYYAQQLQRYIIGEREPLFLKKLSALAAQAGDKDGKQRIGNDYITSLQSPLTEESIKTIAEFTNSTRDAGYRLMKENESAFRQSLGERPYTVKMMNLIYAGEMKDLLENGQAPDWTAIESRTKAFGAPGEEILLRAKTVHYFNAQDWPAYAPVAKEYLEKYGNNVPDNERKMFTEAISNANMSTK